MLFVPYPAFGHVHPMLPVIRELVDRGVRVRVVAGPRHDESLRAVGAEVLPLSVRSDVQVPARLPGRAARYLGARWRKWVVDRDAAAIVRAEVRRDRPTLVVVDPMMGGADRVARHAGVPTALFSTTYAQGAPVPAWWRRNGRAGLGALVVNRLRVLPRRFRHDRPVLVNAVPQLQPARFELGDRVRFLGPFERLEEDLDLAHWGLPAAGPVLLVSPGTVFAWAPGFFTAVARAFAGTPWHVVMATGAVEPTALAPLPDNVIARRRVPQLALLRHATVFLTHAGMNSALEAMARGVPMVVAPRAGDQRFVARQLVGLGLAGRLPAARSDAVRGAVERVAAGPLIRAAAVRWQSVLADQASTSGAVAAADLLLAHSGNPLADIDVLPG